MLTGRIGETALSRLVEFRIKCDYSRGGASEEANQMSLQQASSWNDQHIHFTSFAERNKWGGVEHLWICPECQNVGS